MSMTFRTKRADDFPLSGIIEREKKGRYSVSIYFAKSGRFYTEELVFAPNAPAVKRHMARMYPTLKFKKGRQ